MRTVYYFTADWCQPCKKTRPIVEEINRDQTQTKFQIIDVDDNSELVKTFDIKSVPTFILIEDGKEKNRMVGSKNREELEGFINE